MESRLVTFGCSITFGQALPDIWDYKKMQTLGGPSKYAWPQILANKLDVECVNLGIPGASNKEIWWNALNFKFLKNDIIIFLWSYINRFCLITKDKNVIIRELPADETEGKGDDAKNKDDIYESKYAYDRVIDFYLRVNHIYEYLKKNKIKNYHIIFNDRLYSRNGKPIGLFIDWNYVNFLKTKTPLWVVRREYPRGEDGQHPGKKAHAVMADLIYYELENVL